ncbi:MAG: ribbon-helix-helix domain-containing protein [Candidatus Sulfotelmatobacter sp.]|jgi:Holliday junction resolvase
MEELIRWSIDVSKDTDLTLRTFLDCQGAETNDFSKFVEDAVRWRMFHLTIMDLRERNANIDPDELQRIIDENVTEARAERYAKEKAEEI